MYEVQTVLTNLDQHIVWFLCFGGIGALCNWWLLIEGIRLGFKDKTHSISVICLLFWAAHDVSFVLLWKVFFVDIGHWVWKLFWFNILGSVITEIILLYQVVRFSGKELLPGFTTGQRCGFLAVAFGFAVIIFWYLKMAMGGDPMFLYMMPLTIIMCPMFVIPMAMRRQSQKGQSRRLMGIYILLTLGIWPAWYVLHPIFQSPIFIALGAAVIIWSLANLLVLNRLPSSNVTTDIG